MYESGAHTKHRLRYHLVWIPKYRKKILTGRLAQRVKELLEECARANRWKIEELSLQVDHIHILIQIGPSMSLSKVVQLFKGGTSRIIRREFPVLEDILWGDSFWADGYFAETYGQCNEAVIREYVKNQ